MPRWWRRAREDEQTHPPVCPSSPPPEDEVGLPDPEVARSALRKSLESKKRSDDLSKEVHTMLNFIRAAREQNNFAEGIVEMIREGR